MQGLKQLTTRGEERLAALSDAADDAQSQVLSVTRRIGEVTDAMRALDANRTEDFATLQRELDRHRQRQTAAQETFTAQSRVLTAVRSWLRGLSQSTILDDCDDELADLQSGEDYLDGVVRVRVDVEQLTQARSAISRAVLPTDTLYDQACAYVDALAAKGRPPLRIDRDKLIVGIPPDHVAMLAWLDPDRFKDRLREEIEAQRKRESSPNLVVLSASERAQRLAVLHEAILRHERQEEAMIREAADLGTVIQRREKCSPLALLGMHVVSQAARRAA